MNCKGCDRAEERTPKGWRPIKLDVNGNCRAYNEAAAEVAAMEQ